MELLVGRVAIDQELCELSVTVPEEMVESFSLLLLIWTGSLGMTRLELSDIGVD